MRTEAPAGPLLERQPFVVADVGGTTLRIARCGHGAPDVSDVVRCPVEGLGRYPDERAEQLQSRVVEQLAARLRDYLSAGSGATAVGISFAGPIDERGMVLAAPTIWGAGGRPLPVGELLQRRLGVPVLVTNDITAAAWRYAAEETQPFCVLTVSSGIGNKVFRDGEVLVDPLGHGGELGHWRVDPAPDAMACDCGGRGHLGAIASGRGLLAAARLAATREPDRFSGSALAELVQHRPEAITNPLLVAALRADDPFTTELLCRSLRYLAMAISCLFSAIGIRRYIIIGGFALAVGDRFRRYLTAELVNLGCFGLAAGQVAEMVRLGAPDDDHSLIGVGRLVSGRAAQFTGEWRGNAYADHR